MTIPSLFDSTVGSAVAGYWPSLDPQTVRDWAGRHQDQSTQLTEAASSSVVTYAPLFHELTRGQAADALQMSLVSTIKLWYDDADEHLSAYNALNSVADYLSGLQTDLQNIVLEYEPQYEKNSIIADVYQMRGDNKNAQKYADRAQNNIYLAVGEAESHAAHAADRISSALNGKFGTAPDVGQYSQGGPAQPKQPSPGRTLTVSSQLKPGQNPMAALAM